MADNIDAENGAGPVSRSSVTHVAYIVQKFDDVKKDLVRQIGFGGILDLPQITKVDRKFTLWLLSKVDTRNKCLVVNEQYVADIIDFEVARIISIPVGSRQVCPLDQTDKKKKIEFYCKFISSGATDCHSLVAAENNVKAEFVDGMVLSKEEKDKFKVSFVVWVMGHLLAPTKKHNVGSDRFWGALLCPDEINQFNWAGYVVDELINAAVDVQNAINSNKNVSTITGCAVVLQIIYFESINMGSLSRPSGISPRIKAYDGKSLSLLIAADKASSSTDSGNATWGSSVRRLQEVPNENLQPSPDQGNAEVNNANRTEHRIISDLGKHLRETLGDKLSTSQSIAFSWFNARCTQHLKHLRLSIQQDTIQLARKLFPTTVICNTSTPSGPDERNLRACRPAYSDPPQAHIRIKTALNNKRACVSSSSAYTLRSTKKQSVFFNPQELPDMPFSSMYHSGQVAVADEESDTASQNSALLSQADMPSFDLGFDFNTEANEDPAFFFANNVFNDNPVENDTFQPGCTESSSCGFNGTQEGDKITMISLVSIHGSSENSGSLNDNNSYCCRPPVTSNRPCVTPISEKGKEQEGFTTPDQKIKNFSTSPRSISKMLAEGDLVNRMTYLEDNPNMNMKPWDEDYSESPIKKRIVVIPMMPESPWIYKLCHRTPPSDIIDKLFLDVSMCQNSDLNRVWLSHTCPRHIEIDGVSLQESFISVTGMSYDVFDLSIRRLRQLDDQMYSEKPNLHWRHIIESEFAIFALAGEISYNRKAIIEQFIGPSLQYRIEDCRMVIIPAYVLLNWSCYIFDFKEKCVHVIDPLFKKDQAHIFTQMHSPNVSKVASSVLKCLDMFFENWRANIDTWQMNFVEPCIVDPTSAETGLLTLMYIREFDGSKINHFHREQFLHFKKLMLYELMCLSDNSIKPPVSLTFALDD